MREIDEKTDECVDEKIRESLKDETESWFNIDDFVSEDDLKEFEEDEIERQNLGYQEWLNSLDLDEDF